MALVPCKGTLLKIAIAGGVLADVGQVLSIDVAEAKTEEYEARTLDGGVGITKRPTGYTDPGSVSGELFFDPVLATQLIFTTAISTAATPVGEDHLLDGSITFADAAATAWTFSTSGVGFGVTVAMSDGLKGSFSMSCSDVIGY